MQLIIIYNTESNLKLLTTAIMQIKDVEIIATAQDVFTGAEFVKKLNPDGVLLTTEMPGMSAIEFIRYNMQELKKPIIMASSHSHKCKHLTMQALESGSVDFINLPSAFVEGSIKEMTDALRKKLSILPKINFKYWLDKQKETITNGRHKSQFNLSKKNTYRLIVVYSSTGAVIAMKEIITQLPSNIPCILLITQMPHGFTKIFADRLNDISQLNVKEAETGDEIAIGRVLIAPGDFHINIVPDNNHFIVLCQPGEKVYEHRPSANVLMFSVAEHLKNSAIGIILTGAGRDGAEGLRVMKEAGAKTIVQNYDSSLVYDTAKYAMEIGAVNYDLPLNEIPNMLVKILADTYI